MLPTFPPHTPATPPATPNPRRSTRKRRLTPKANTDLSVTPHKRNLTVAALEPPPAPKKTKRNPRETKNRPTLNSFTSMLSNNYQPFPTLTETPSSVLAEPISDDELKYPDYSTAALSENIPGRTGQYIYDQELFNLQSILERIRSGDSLYDALFDLGQLLAKYLPKPRENVPPIDQDPDDENRTIERIRLTYVRQLFRTEDEEDEIWENSAKLFYTPEEWNYLVQHRVPVLKARITDPIYADREEEPAKTNFPVTPITPQSSGPASNVTQMLTLSDPHIIGSPLSPSPTSVGKARSKTTFSDRFAAHRLSVPPPRKIQPTYTEPVILPTSCQVTKTSLQDHLLVKEGVNYNALPPLRAGALVSWNTSAPRKGHVKFSEWQSLATTADVLFLIDWFKFTRSDAFINPARIDPRELTAYNPSSNYVRQVLFTRDTHAPVVCMIPIHVESSILTTFAQTSSSPPKRFRKIDGLLHSQDADRIISVITMVLGEENSEIAADIVGDVLTFSTRFEPGQAMSNRGSSAPQNRVFSPSTSGSSTASSLSGSYALPFDADVPVYDGRPVDGTNIIFDVDSDLPYIDASLTRYPGEIPSGSFAVIACTITTSTQNRTPNIKVNFNIRFAILLGTPA
ncbi:hypothetical protein K435DRAFT_875253 [Dendrothele bispora CBS 962.96]|uniref:Uncharacterized protein n=1 Tax=Dendrothele bispora (strain CBS 962.96) TaxID=1314807 RepID=A0A4S8KUQ8_DENBC|nr:hypothetical protein K435DRAFT_875253 [Dendrothele bispora CBS 962.96]